MMAPFAAIATVPTARMVITTAGRPSGMDPIASETPMVNSVVKSSPSKRPITTMLRKASTAIPMMKRVTLSTCRASGVFSSFCSLSMVAMWPTAERMPVSVTRISPWPRVTFVSMKAMFRQSPRGGFGVAITSPVFSTAVLSPVRAASSICRFAAAITRPSAGTRSPASTITMSPGTIPSASIREIRPSRRTFATIFIILFSAATLAPAFASCL